MWRLSLLLFLVLGIAVPADAATLYLTPSVSELHPGNTLTVAVRLEPDTDECVNVVNGVLTYDAGIQPVDISRGRSIMPIWVEEPVIDTANRRITFAGGIPNGYCGRIEGDPRLTNTVLEVVFQAPGFRIGATSDTATATVQFTNETSVLLNDGRGTPANLQTAGAEIFVHKRPSAEMNDEWNAAVTADTQAPEEFSIVLEQDPSIFNGKYFIIFNTTDKQTGIDHYEVIEESLIENDLFSWGAADAPWVPARSPYLLKDQSLNSVIRVKALDKAGNEYIATLVPEEAMRTTSTQQYVTYGLLAAAVVLVLTLIISVAVLVWKRRRRLQDEAEEEVWEEDESDALDDEYEEEEEGEDNVSEEYERR